MADRVAVMRDGRLVQVDAPKALYARPANHAVASFIGHANLWRGRIVSGTSVETPFGTLQTAPHGFAVGEPIVVLVRPEKLAIGPAADGVNTLTGKVTRDRFLGSFRRFDFEVGGVTLLGETGDMAEVTSIHIAPGAVQLLADQDGKTP